MQRVLVGTVACLQAGLRSNGATEFPVPDRVRMPLEDLRRWSRVLQAGIAAETIVYGKARGGADDKALLGRLWGRSGHDVDTAQREQRRARREIEQLLRRDQADLSQRADQLLSTAPRLGRCPRLSPLVRCISTARLGWRATCSWRDSLILGFRWM